MEGYFFAAFRGAKGTLFKLYLNFIYSLFIVAFSVLLALACYII